MVFLLPQPAPAQRLQVPVGPRAIAMGGAFSSIADDYSALFWNPAGLARIGHQEVAGTHSNLYGADVIDNYLALAVPVTPELAVGTDWYHSGFNDSELDFGENRIDLAAGYTVIPKFSVGLGAKLVTRNIDLDQVEVRQGTGVGLDLGLLAEPFRGVRFGVVGQDIFDTRLGYSDGNGSAVAYPRSLRASVSYARSNLGALAVDLDDRVHVGAEVLPVDLLALRAGFQTSTDGGQDPIWSFGAGIRWKILRFDYAYEIHPDLDNTSYFGVSTAFHLNPVRIRIEAVEADELYSSLYKTHSQGPVGTVRIRNLDDEPLSTRLAVFIPGAMDSPTEREVILRPLAVQDVPITAVMAGKVMKEDENRPLQVEVTASYRSRRVVRTDKGVGQTVLYAPGAINWGEGVDQAAAFITPGDPVVASVARQAGRTASRLDRRAFYNRNIAFTAAVFEALDVIELAYVPDPNNPYSTISEIEHAVDTIQYPRQTLHSRSGDCDDTSVLMASLLESVGIPTKLVDAPGHLMILAGTGVGEANRLALPVDPSLLVAVDGELWIPLETTAIDKGFSEAWRIGAAVYQGWAARGQLALVDIASARRRFESALPRGSEDLVTLDPDELTVRLARDQEVVSGWRDAYLASRYEDLGTGTITGEALSRLARVYFVAGRAEEAAAMLEEALAMDPSSPRIQNNLAVVRMAEGDAASALERVAAAASLDPNDPGIRLNHGLALVTAGKRQEGMTVLTEGIKAAGGYDQSLQILGIFPQASPSASGERREDVVLNPTQELLRAAMTPEGGSGEAPLAKELNLYWKP